MHFLKYLTMYIFSLSLLFTANVFAASELSVSVNSDIEKIINARHSFEQMQSYINKNTELFLQNKTTKKRLTSRAQREEIWVLWQSFLDRIIMLDFIGKKYEQLYKNSDKAGKKEKFRIAYAAFLLQYRYAVEIISILENDPAMHTMLNESVSELGLQKNSYKKIKFRFLNVTRAAEFAHLSSVYALYGIDDELRLSPGIKTDNQILWRLGLGDGTTQTLKNALSIIQDTGFTVWFPLQASVSKWMGDVKVLRKNHSLISADQIAEMKSILEPGDILLERREWYLSNIGLPGYWPHAALYIGSIEQRQKYFNDDLINQHYATVGGFEKMLEKNYPKAYSQSNKTDDSAHLYRLIEAISEGVSFTTLEHSVAADSVVILRPRLNKLEKSHAIKRAFHYSGRPYDFNFDFLTDAKLVCTELIYKVFEPSNNIKGLKFPIRQVLGRSVTTANDIAEMFDREYESEKAQLELIAFYDGHERQGIAIKSNVDAFRQSWKRPKMFIWLQDTPFESNK